MEIEVFIETSKGNSFVNYGHNWEEPLEQKKEMIPFTSLFEFIKSYVDGLGLERKDSVSFERHSPPITNSLRVEDNKLIYHSRTEVKNDDVHLKTFEKSVMSFWYKGKEVFLYEVFEEI